MTYVNNNAHDHGIQEDKIIWKKKKKSFFSLAYQQKLSHLTYIF